jgi:uncharacterized ferredoxin-like protein
MSRRQVYLLRVEFKYELEKAQSGIRHIFLALKRPAWKAKHGTRTIAFLLVSNEELSQLVQRLRPALESAEGIFDYWCHVAPFGVIARHGGMDSLTTRLNEAWLEARQWHKPEHMGQAKVFDTFKRRMENRENSTIVKVGVKSPTVGQATQDSNGPKSK